MINTARRTARAHAWAAAGEHAPDHRTGSENPLVIELDATLVTAHSEKEEAAPNYKRGFGFHPLCAFVDHGGHGTGEPVAMLLRPGNAGSNTAADHIAVVKDALAQLPSDPGYRVGRKVMIRTDGAGGTHALIEYLTKRHLGYSIGFSLTDAMAAKIAMIPKEVWTPAYDADGKVCDGAWVAELTGLLDLSGWPTGMRVIVRKDRPHLGAQVRFTDTDGLRLTAFVTDTTRGRRPDLELRHRRRARCGPHPDHVRHRTAEPSAARFDQNRIWLAVVQLACELTAWTQMLAFNTDPARRREPNACGCVCSRSPAVSPGMPAVVT
ncbi:IS1380 family transposase [Prescottella agglutinans]|uniref:IS1380 family transposase n=1 Tax=Prescottella agglutinans TaxID=1644129 RepID=UPI003D95869C